MRVSLILEGGTDLLRGKCSTCSFLWMSCSDVLLDYCTITGQLHYTIVYSIIHPSWQLTSTLSESMARMINFNLQPVVKAVVLLFLQLQLSSVSPAVESRERRRHLPGHFLPTVDLYLFQSERFE